MTLNERLIPRLYDRCEAELGAVDVLTGRPRLSPWTENRNRPERREYRRHRCHGRA